MMVNRLGCERPDLYRAVVNVIGTLVVPPDNVTGIVNCDNSYTSATAKQKRSFSVLHIHGTADPVVPWNGGGWCPITSVPADIASWRARMRCNDNSNQTLNISSFTNQLWTECGYAGAQVELVTVAGGGHAWFNVPGEFNTGDYAFAFFQRVSPASGGDDGGGGTGVVTVVAVVIIVLCLVAAAVGGIVYHRRRKAQDDGGEMVSARSKLSGGMMQKLPDDHGEVGYAKM
jgi:hypothetical protein